MSIGENIKKFRLEKGWTQKKLGEECKPRIAESTIRRYELGKLNPKLETLQKIADALNIPITKLNDKIEPLRPKNEELINNMIIRAIYRKPMLSIGQRIKEQRKSAKLSRKELSAKSGVSLENITAYENNSITNIPAQDIANIANALHLKTEYLNGTIFHPDYNIRQLLGKLGWYIEPYKRCLENNDCPLTKDEMVLKWFSEAYWNKKCENCPYDSTNYILYNHETYYIFTEQEYKNLEDCILPYLKLRITEYTNNKKPLNENDINNMGIRWLAKPKILSDGP